jgi:hypothetical protein
MKVDECYAYNCKHWNKKERGGCLKVFKYDITAIIGSDGKVVWVCPNFENV